MSAFDPAAPRDPAEETRPMTGNAPESDNGHDLSGFPSPPLRATPVGAPAPAKPEPLVPRMPTPRPGGYTPPNPEGAPPASAATAATPAAPVPAPVPVAQRPPSTPPIPP